MVYVIFKYTIAHVTAKLIVVGTWARTGSNCSTDTFKSFNLHKDWLFISYCFHLFFHFNHSFGSSFIAKIIFKLNAKLYGKTRTRRENGDITNGEYTKFSRYCQRDYCFFQGTALFSLINTTEAKDLILELILKWNKKWGTLLIQLLHEYMFREEKLFLLSCAELHT